MEPKFVHELFSNETDSVMTFFPMEAIRTKEGGNQNHLLPSSSSPLTNATQHIIYVQPQIQVNISGIEETANDLEILKPEVWTTVSQVLTPNFPDFIQLSFNKTCRESG